MTKAIRLLASVAMILLLMNIGSQARQRRSNSIQEEGQREASKFWSKYVATCGGSHYIKRTHAVFDELRGFQIVMRYDSLTEADRLNGIQAQGLTGYTATSYRSYQNGAWRRWENGGSALINSVRFQKVRGRWSFQPVIHYDKVGEIISCAEVPGFRSEASKEIPTNAIDLDDYRRLPIHEFSFWESNTNLSGDKFPKSTTTFVNWRISFERASFDGSLPPLEGHWFKDGVTWAEPNNARFTMSNVSQGLITAGKGWSDPGQWELGKYTVKLYLRKQLIAQKSFEIVSDESLPAEVKLHGVYYRVDPNGRSWFLKFFDDGRVMEIISASPSDFQTSLDRAWMCFNQYWEYGEYTGRISCHDLSVGVGSFKVAESQLNFSTRGMFGRDNKYRIDFTGTASTASLNLSWNTIERHSGIGTFTYLECPRNLKYRCVK